LRRKPGESRSRSFRPRHRVPSESHRRLVASHAILIDLDAKPRPIGDVRIAAFGPNGVSDNVVGKPGVGQCKAPGDVRDD
jgi:hypothetical protein